MSKISNKEKNFSVKIEGYELKSENDVIKHCSKINIESSKYGTHEYSNNTNDKCLNLHKDKYFYFVILICMDYTKFLIL
jgi:hypothetical protein